MKIVTKRTNKVYILLSVLAKTSSLNGYSNVRYATQKSFYSKYPVHKDNTSFPGSHRPKFHTQSYDIII